MFPRRERLSRAAFPKAVSHGRRVSSANFSVIVPDEARGYAVVVSKKVARLSVTRHRMKRQVLAALRSLRLPPALVVFPKSSAAALSTPLMRAELSSLLSKIHS